MFVLFYYELTSRKFKNIPLSQFWKMSCHRRDKRGDKETDYIKLRLQINIFELHINLGSTVQGELAALAVWGVVKQPVYIEFWQQITTPKSAVLPPFGKGRWFFVRKIGGIDLDKITWFAIELCYRTYNRISYINKMFSNLSVSCADSSLYQREPSLRFVWVVVL